MTDRQFREKVADLLKRYRRRIETLMAAQRGSIALREISVEGHWVKRHYVEDYTRLIPIRPKKVVSKKRKS